MSQTNQTQQISIAGIPDEHPAPLDAPMPAGMKIASRQSFRLGSGREATAPVAGTITPDALVRVTTADGFDLWLRGDDALRELSLPGQARGAADGVTLLDPRTALAARRRRTGGGRRDAGDVIEAGIEALDVFGIDLAGKTATAIGEWAENKLLDANGSGLYRLALSAEALAMEKIAAIEVAEDNPPLLVFIHGTGSSTRGSFGELWDAGNAAGKATRAALAARYGEHVYALEHRTLTESPLSNALDLIQALPAEAKLHLVTHSRGGLVGDLLCLGQRQGDVLRAEVLDRLFAADRTLAETLGLGTHDAIGYPAQRELASELLAALDAKGPRVERYVRAACPALGTTLASGRLDRWLSVLRYVGGPALGSLLAFLLAVVKERTDPRSLPGLEAMMPGSALVRLLNLDGLRVEADLSVIAGDIEGDSLWGRLKLALPDLFFDGDHDLVVNTGSMYGGVRRVRGARYYFTQGPEVCHFQYFRNADSVGQLQAGLLDPEGPAARFEPLRESQRQAPARAARAAPPTNAPFAIVLPGIMGSHLSEGGERVWLDFGRMAAGGIARLKIDRPGVTASDVFGDFYGDFIDFLGATHDVAVLPYDWRISVCDSAARLATLIEERLPLAEAGGRGIHIVAHSMGGLVARVMLAQRDDLWRRLKSLPAPAGFRLLMLGTPNRGSYQAMRLMVGQYAIANWLALLDPHHSAHEMVDIINDYPGAAELLPWSERDPDFADPLFWRRLRAEAGENWPEPDPQALRTARATWELLRKAPADGSSMSYVAGWAGRTACGYAVETDPIAGYPARRLAFVSTGRGDGTVPWELGRLAGVDTWYAEGVEHDRLLAHTANFPAYLDLLLTGRTNRQLLPQEPAGVRGAAIDEDREPLPADMPPNFPTPDNYPGFGGLAPSRRAGARRGGERAPTRVAIRHGDLAYARFPVCVGHYQGDTKVGAERRLDEALDGALSARLTLDIYPGRIGTWEIFIATEQEARPAGAIVIGLGQVGAVSPGALAKAMSSALLDYALQVDKWHDERFGAAGAMRSVRISTLLVGTGAGGFSVTDSVTAILQAVRMAKGRLASLPTPARVCFDEVEILEVYEDIAIQAACALANALRTRDLAAEFSWPEAIVVAGIAGLLRSSREEAPGWWRRLEIAHDSERERLNFTLLTDRRARAEHSLLASQIRLADDFVAAATTSTRNDSELGRTLYEMLIPNALKEMAPDRRDTVLLVDAESARFPWEMLDDRWTDAGPLAIASGLLRQLKTASFRPSPAQTCEPTALVIGDPRLDDPAHFAPLPGAAAEATAAAQALRDAGFRVVEEIGTEQTRILNGLHGNAWRILHLAGHGVHNHPLDDSGDATPCEACERPLAPRTTRRSGMLIGRNRVLTPGDIAQMRWVPELVFINCCHLGQTLGGEATPHGVLAANLAVEFIQMGVKAVVAAGWAVDDGAARCFALHFYGEMFRGLPFGRAVHEARRHVRAAYPHCNTWGAYQCYGDPDYLLADTASRIDPPSAPYVAPSELVTDLRNLAQRARANHVDPKEIDALLTRIPVDVDNSWMARADVASALGIAHGEVGQFRTALKYLDQAVSSKDAAVSLRDLELRASFRTRRGLELANAGQINDARVHFDQAEGELTNLLAYGTSIERYNLLGSLWKRRAMASSGVGRNKALQQMATAYKHATDLIPTQPSIESSFYATINHHLANYFSKLTQAPGKAKKANANLDPDLEALAAECRALAARCAEANRRSPSIWIALDEPNAQLLAALIDGTLVTSKTDIIRSYTHVLRRGASQAELASVVDQVNFIENMIASMSRQSAIRRAIGEIAVALEGSRLR